MTYKLLPCPFCGEVPTLTKKPMWQGSHGYYGCYGFSVKCENEDCAITPFTRTFDTIYEKDENKQKKKAIAAWNRRAQPENKPLTCEGCKSQGKYENEVEYGYPSPCTRCARRAIDNYRCENAWPDIGEPNIKEKKENK